MIKQEERSLSISEDIKVFNNSDGTVKLISDLAFNSVAVFRV